MRAQAKRPRAVVEHRTRGLTATTSGVVLANTKNTTCTIDNCGSKVRARGWCAMHYTRWQRHGDPRYAPVIDESTERARFWSHVEKTEGCWAWTAKLSRGGYGTFVRNGYKFDVAHRYSWELANGPIPEGMFIDHICFTPACVNPDHLRLATPKQNMEYRSGGTKSNTSGVRGVTWSKKAKKWQAQVGHHRKTLFLGYYDSVEDAAAVVHAKRAELFTFPEVA